MNTTFIHSSLAADPELVEIVEIFVQEMPDRIDALEAQARDRSWQQLAETAHQLDGADGSCGFGILTPYAARLELAARDARHEKTILLALHELLHLCRRMHAGVWHSAASTI